MNRTLTFVLLLMLSAGLFSQNPFPLVADRCHIELSFDYIKETLQGNDRMTILNQSDPTISQIPLMLYRLMKVHSVNTDDGQGLKFHQSVVQFEDFAKLQTNRILVDFEIPPHESRVIQIAYSEHLLGYAKTGMSYITDGISPGFTLIRPDAYAYPIIYKPSIIFLINNLKNHLFLYDIVVAVPDTLVVASGGRLKSRTPVDANQITCHYASRKPSWPIDIGIASYGQLNTRVLNLFYLNHENAARHIAEYGANAMQQYTQWWGELQPPENVNIIETERNSGREADELAHLWHVIIKEEEGLAPRWEEGLAEFSACLLLETLFEEMAGALKRAADNNLRRLCRRFCQLLERHSSFGRSGYFL